MVEPIKNIYPPPPENAEKFAFFQNIRTPVLASPSLPSGILQKPENLFCRGNRRHNKQISHLTSKCWLSGLFCNFSLYVKLCGGAVICKDEHSPKSQFSASNAASISSNGIFSMFNGFLLALTIRVKYPS